MDRLESGYNHHLRIVIGGMVMYHREAAPLVRMALVMRRNVWRRLDPGLYQAVLERLEANVRPL